VKKGETLIDTAMTLNAMHADAIVIRHGSSRRGAADRGQGRLPGAQRRRRPARAPHAGPARRADHPPRQGRSSAASTCESICGDILHSRVARSNIHVPDHAGRRSARLRPAGADAGGIEAMKVTPFHDFDAALKGADVVMMLRLQQERMSGQFIPSPREYRHLYGLTLDRLAKARSPMRW
jgi:aspartate carbamoyltransferase catalytic subunit